MSTIVETTEWECETVRLVKLDGLKRHPNFPYNRTRSGRYYQVPSREIRALYVHHAAGPRKEGIAQPVGLANWVVRDPKFKRDEAGEIVYRKTRRGMRPKIIGGGRGWPGACYHFQIPAIPDVQDGKIIVYRLWDDDWRIWHTGGIHNTYGISVNVGGWYESRHAKSSIAQDRPDQTAMEGLERLVLDYLLPRYGLEASPETLLGHFDAGKATCPGDFLEAWVRDQRGENVIDLDPKDAVEQDQRPLRTWKQKQQALVDLGFFIGDAGVDGVLGYYTRAAVTAFQSEEGLVADGVWGTRTERAARVALARG